MAVSWQDQTVAAGETKVYNILLGVSDIAESPALPRDPAEKPIALYLTKDGEKNITVNAKVTDESGRIDTLYYTINGGAEQTLAGVTADGTEKTISGIIAASNFANNGDYIIKLWVQNDKNAFSQTVTKTITVSGTTIGGEGLEVGPIPPPTYAVTIRPEAFMTKTTDSGNAKQKVPQGSAMTNVVYTADAGWYFPINYSVTPKNGITVTRDSNTQITVSGTPTAATSIAITAPNRQTNAALPVITNDLSTQQVTYERNATAAALSITVSPPSKGTVSYQWYSNDTNDTTLPTAVGTNSDSYTPQTTTAGTSYYYCVVTNTIADNGDGGNKTATATSKIANIKVNKAAMPTITVTPYTAPYDGNTHNKCSVSGCPEGSTVTYSENGTNFSSTMPTVKVRTTGSPFWVKVEHANYITWTSVELKAVVTGAKPVVTLEADKRILYTGSAVSYNGTVTKTGVNNESGDTQIPGAVSYQYSLKSGEGAAPAEGYTAGMPKDAGTYWLQAKCAKGGNYAESDWSAAVNFTIYKLSTAPTISNISAPAPVQAGSPLTLTAPTVNDGGAAVTNQGWQTCATNSATASNWATFTGGTVVTYSRNKHYLRYFATNSEGTTYSNAEQITVTKIPVTNTAQDANITYSGATYDVAALFTRGIGAGTPTYTLQNGTGTGSLSGSTLTITKAGTIQINLTTAEQGDYAAGATVTATLTVSKGASPAAPTVGVTAETIKGKKDGKLTGVSSLMEYKLSAAGGSYSPISGTTATGLAAGDYLVRIAETDLYRAGNDASVTVTEGAALTVTFASKGGSPVAPKTDISYNTAISAPAAPTLENSTFGGWVTTDGGSTQWNFTSDKVTENITLYAKWTRKAAVSITETVQTKTYTGSTLAFDITGAPNSGFTVTYKKGNTAVPNPTNAGSYDVTITRDEDATYAAYSKTIAGGLVIAQKPLTEAMLTITGSYTYTGVAITPTYKVTDGSVLTSDDYTAGVTDNTNAGTNTAKVTITGKGNYTGSISKTFAIAKAPLTVTVKSPLNISKVYDGGTAVTTTVSDRLEVTGLQNGETATASGTWAYADKKVGSSKTVNITGVAITYGTATAGNYSYTQAALTASGAIEQLTLTHDVSVTSTKAYDGTAIAAATGDLTNKIISDVVTLDKAFAFNSKDVSAANQITATTWRINGADKDNYTLPAFAPVTGATITPKSITVAAAASPGVTKVYDGNTSATVDPADYAISGTASGETLTLGLTATYNAAGVTAANKVTCIGFTLADGSGLAANYNLTTTTFEIAASITAKPLTTAMFPAIPNQNYTGGAITPSVILTDGTPSILAPSDYTLSYASNTAVGTATVTATAAAGSNYSGNVSTTFIIENAALPGGTTNNTVFADYATISTTWSNSASGVTFTGNSGWTVGTDGTTFGARVTFPDEGDGVSKPVYVKNGGDVYITTVTYKLDKTDPKISAAARSAAWSSDNQTITLTASDALSGLAGYGLSTGENQQPTTWQESNVLTVTETGSYWAWAKDKAGNTTHFGQSLDQKIDRNAPAITKVDIPAANAQGWHTTAPTVTVSATDTESGGMQYSFDGGQQWQDAHSKTFENGTNLVDIWVQDAVYNTAKQDAFTLKVDTAIPAAPTVTGYVSGTWTAENVVLTLSNATLTTSGHAKYQVKIGAAEWADVTGTTVTHSENTVDAGVTYQFRSVNNAGTAGTPSAKITVKRRALDAGTVLDSEENKYADADLALSGTPNAEGWYGTSPVTVTVTPKTEITVSESEKYPADTYYKLDNGVETKLAGSTISVTGDGNHSLVIWTKDAAGNETTHLTKTIKIDKTAPTITNVTTPSDHWGKENETIHFTAADTTSGVKTIAVTDSEGKDYPVTENKSFVADKNETYTITVTDQAGKQTTKTVVVSKIDKTAPAIALPIFDDAKWFGATEITAAVTDTAGSGVATVTVSGGHFVDATDIKIAGKFTATEPIANAYTYTIAATDNVGNSASKTVTIKIDLRIDKFMAQTKNLTENSDFSHLAGAKDWYDKQNQIVKNHIDANDAAKIKLENLNTWIEAKAEAAAGALSDKVTNADNLEEIAQAKKDFDSLPKSAQDSVSQATKDALNSKLDDAKKAQNAIDQLENAFKPGATYEEKQGAKDAYDKLTDEQKALVPSEKKDLHTSISEDLAAIDAVLDKLNAVKKPYTPATKALITTAKDAYDALTPKQKAAFPAAEKAELDALVTLRDHAQTVETAIKALGDGPALDVLQQIKADYNALTADEKSLVDGALKTALDKKYQDKLDALTADEKAAAEFATHVEEVKKAPTTDQIQQLMKDYTALSDTAEGKLTEQTKTDYGKLIDDLAKAKAVIDKLKDIDLDKLAPADLTKVQDALKDYKNLTPDQKKLVDEATDGKPGILDRAVTEIADTTEKVEKIPGHIEGSQNPDGTPKLDDCGNAGNEKPDGSGTGGHNYSDHRKAIEDAKIAYEKLSDAGRKLVSDGAKDKINGEYKALMAYLEYVSTAKTATTTVEVAGLAEKLALPADAVTAGKTLISVVMKDEKPAAMPPVPKGKGEALSVNVKLVAKIFADANDANPVATEPVQPKPGEKILVKLLLPKGFQLETLEIWHVKDSGSRSRISDFWLVTEPDGTYALFEVASFSHFVFFAEKVPVIDGGEDPIMPPKPSIPGTSGGSTTITPPRPKPGASVTVTPKPDPGYQVDQIIVTDQNGHEVPVTKHENGSYSYIQPKGKVTIQVTYRPIQLPFTDVEEHNWFYESVKCVYEKGLMLGTAADKFSPYVNADRGMIITILWRLSGAPEPKRAAAFSDVSAETYSAKAIAWAAENGIVKGYRSGKFGPKDPVTREQLAAILYRYAQFQGLDISAMGDLSKFSDQPSQWAAEAVRWAVSAEIIAGKGHGVLDPKGEATRAEVAAMLMRYLEKTAK